MKNYAYALGREKYEWWPSWEGECVAIVASGPSLKQVNLDRLQNRIHVIAIKAAIDVVPFAEIVYGCDAPWWVDRKGLPTFKGLKFFHGITVANQYKDMHRVEIDMKTDAMLVDKPLTLGNGGNSGFQALNLAIQFGATSIILLGFDMRESSKDGSLHFYGRNKWAGSTNPLPSNFKRWHQGFAVARKSIEKIGGIEIVNCSPETALKEFRCAPLEQTIQEWGL